MKVNGRWRQIKENEVYEHIWRNMKANEGRWSQMRTNEGRGRQMEANKGN